MNEKIVNQIILWTFISVNTHYINIEFRVSNQKERILKVKKRELSSNHIFETNHSLFLGLKHSKKISINTLYQ
jgi:hypothetical protein